MTEDDLFPFGRRALGSALMTGASGAGLALSMARPSMDEAVDAAIRAADEFRKAARDGARSGLKSAFEAGRPGLDNALATKDLLRRRALGSLPPQVADRAEAWRQRAIGGEKLAYYGSKRFAHDMEPVFELARDRSRNLLVQAVHAFEDVADVALSATATFGDELARGDLPPPPRPRAKPSGTKRKGRAKKPSKKSP
jgi:hypothetical protein